MNKHLTRRDAIKQGTLALVGLSLPFPLTALTRFNPMTNIRNADVIIIGGSYAGLSAAMALGRALRNVLIIDSGLPCNRQTPHSHNFITQDGERPGDIANRAREQVLRYDTVRFQHDLALHVQPTENGFEVHTQSGDRFTGSKLIFATGVKDILPDIRGFSECWGISVVHCPYCHGYEIKHERTGILANGDGAFHYARLIRNWTDDLTVFTNGESTLTQEQAERIAHHNIPVVEKEIAHLVHDNGYVQEIIFKDGSSFPLSAIYSGPTTEQHCPIPEMLGCELTEQGLIKVDMLQKTTVENVFACGDSVSPLRSVAYAVATGNMAGAAANNQMVEEAF